MSGDIDESMKLTLSCPRCCADFAYYVVVQLGVCVLHFGTIFIDEGDTHKGAVR